MNCPKCDMYTPDDSYKCMSCGAILYVNRAPAASAYDQRPVAAEQGGRKVWLPVTLLALIAAVLLFLYLSEKGGSRAVNALSPGEEVDISRYVQRGRTTVFDFYSDYCPPCRQISPLLKKLDDKRDDIAVVKIDINRKGVKGIDWQSPLARQFNLQSIPHFKIFDAAGELLQEGDAAYQQVVLWLVTENIR